MAASFAMVVQRDTCVDECLNEQKKLKSSKSCRRRHNISVCVDSSRSLGNLETALVLVVAHPGVFVQAVGVGIGYELDGGHFISQVCEGNYPEENHQTIESDDSPIVICRRRSCACYNDIDSDNNSCNCREHSQVNSIKGKIVDPIGSQAHDDHSNDQLRYSRDKDCLGDI